MEKIRISKAVEDFAGSLGIKIHPLEGGVIYIDADDCKYDAVYCTGRVLAYIKQTHRDLVVTALTVVSVAVCKKGAIVCFERK
jgi:hypothetical protein